MNRFTRSLISICLLLAVAAPSKPVKDGSVAAELVSELSQIQAGQPFTVAVRLQMDGKWHVYWRNPGLDGLEPPRATWQLPEGFQVGELQWPVPHRFDELAPIINYGYKGEVMLLAVVTPPATLAADPVTLAAQVEWVACDEMCVQGSAAVSLTLDVGPQITFDPQWQAPIAAVREQLPATDSGWQFRAARTATGFVLEATQPADLASALAELRYWPLAFDTIDDSAAQVVTQSDGAYQLSLQLSPDAKSPLQRLQGLVVAKLDAGGERALYVDVPIGDSLTPQVSAPAPAVTVGGLLRNILLALLGGLILNLMPCVLPILSLKVLGFVEQAGDDRRPPWVHGLVFTFGVLVSFWIMTVALLALRAGGAALGWGFQLQSPVFVMVLVTLLFVMALSMFGVFEVGTSLTSVGGNRSHSGLRGSFFSGVLATVVATPCTAPYMGAALGYALAQPAWVAMVVFTSIGLGMALPYLVLSASPGLLKYVPRPGAWMESFKQFMGFLLMATVVWLLSVLGSQLGPEGVVIVLTCLIVISIAAWILGRWGTPVRPRGPRLRAQALAGLLAVGGLAAMILIRPQPDVWQPFSPALLSDLRRAGHPVFIDFTADWCVTCKFNERIAFTRDVYETFTAKGIKLLKADWTNKDEVIYRALSEYGSPSVPLYVYYEPGAETPQILPRVITESIVLDAVTDPAQLDLTPQDDADGDGVNDADDPQPRNPRICGDKDGDGCDDCAHGRFDPLNDGPDADGDGICDAAH